MSNVSITGWPTYDTFFIVSLSGWPVYDPNPLRFNHNPKKPVLGSCRVHGLGRTLTPLIKYNTRVKSFVFYLFHAVREIISSFSFFVKPSHLFRKEKGHGTFSVDPFSFFHGFIYLFFYSHDISIDGSYIFYKNYYYYYYCKVTNCDPNPK